MEQGDGRVDALLPPGMAESAERIGVRKAQRNTLNLFVLAVLAGAFIALGAICWFVYLRGK